MVEEAETGLYSVAEVTTQALIKITEYQSKNKEIKEIK